MHYHANNVSFGKTGLFTESEILVSNLAMKYYMFSKKKLAVSLRNKSSRNAGS